MFQCNVTYFGISTHRGASSVISYSQVNVIKIMVGNYRDIACVRTKDHGCFLD